MTDRGRAFVPLGRPAVIRETVGPLNTSPRSEAGGRLVLPRSALEWPRFEVWVYERPITRSCCG
jgi:hypothetical protein